MRKENLARHGWIVLLISVTLLGVLIAGFSYRFNSAIPRGIAGGVTIYLLYYFGRNTKMDGSAEDFLRDPQKGKYIIAALFIPMISYWAAAQIYEMILFLKTLNN